MASWLLPENIADILPRQARALEETSRNLTDLFCRHGFELVMPPIIEYIDSLLTGSATDLDNNTFKFTDQASGRLLGVRADITPQAARIDAHILGRTGVTRLCYKGSVLHARPMHPLASRQPYVVGAELFGATSRAADAEMMKLAVRSVRICGIDSVHFDIGHTGVVRTILAEDRAMSAEMMPAIMRALRMKDPVALVFATQSLSALTREALMNLLELFGDETVLDRMLEVLPPYEGIRQAINEVRSLSRSCGADVVSFDFCDVHGYQYLTGVTFSCHVPGLSQAVLRGGRYDDIGVAFGRARPAVGFTIYLRELVQTCYEPLPCVIIAPASDEASLLALIEELRENGEIVVQLLPGESADDLSDSFNANRMIVCEGETWVVKSIK